jgi:hypothetical protein
MATIDINKAVQLGLIETVAGKIKVLPPGTKQVSNNGA